MIFFFSFCFSFLVIFFVIFFFFFFNDTATTEIYTLSLHDALPISVSSPVRKASGTAWTRTWRPRSEEHTSELQSPDHLVCRLLLEKKKKKTYTKNKKKKKTKKINKQKKNNKT